MTENTMGRETAINDHPDHGALPWLTPSALDPSRQRLYDAITGSTRNNSRRAMPLTDEGGRLEGPFNAMLFSPAVGHALQALGGALRYQGTLPGRLRELAVLEVAVVRSCTFEWLSHAPLAQAAGLSADDIAALKRSDEGSGLTPTERLVRRLTRDLLTSRDLTDEQVEAAKDALGVDGACELLFLVGYYDLLALSMRVWRTPLPQAAEATGLVAVQDDKSA
jgi:4-carboxymuconolactone decarboxylase